MILLTLYFKGNSQIINYINNGGFEEVITNTSTPLFYSAKYWGATDSVKAYGELLSKITFPIKVPLCNYTYQWPRHGSNHLISLQYCPTCSFNKRGYPRNRLKHNLKAGETRADNLQDFFKYLNSQMKKEKPRPSGQPSFSSPLSSSMCA